MNAFCDGGRDKTLILKNRFSKNADPQRTERFKILFQYLLVLIGSVIAGALFTFFFTENLLTQLGSNIQTHFQTIFENCNSIPQAIRLVVRYAFPELICVLLSFLFTFSMLNYLISDLILVYEGFTSGCSVFLLFRLNTGMLWEEILFGITRFGILVCFSVALYRMALYSSQLKRFTETGRPMIHPRTVLRLILCTAIFGTLILLFDLLYCLLIYLL